LRIEHFRYFSGKMHIFLKPYFPCQMFKHFKEKAMTQTANDQRSTVKNPNNIQHTQNQDNRSRQLNPNHKPTKSK